MEIGVPRSFRNIRIITPDYRVLHVSTLQSHPRHFMTATITENCLVAAPDSLIYFAQLKILNKLFLKILEIVKFAVFWDVTPCSVLYLCQRLIGNSRLKLEGYIRFLQNFGTSLPDFTASNPTRQLIFMTQVMSNLRSSWQKIYTEWGAGSSFFEGE